MAVPAAVAAATAAGLRREVTGAVATVRLADPGGVRSLPVLGAALAAELRRLTGEVRIVVLRADRWSSSPPDDGVHAAGAGRAAADVDVDVDAGASHADPPSFPAGPGGSGDGGDDLRDPAGRPGLATGYEQWRDALDRLSDQADLISIAVVDGAADDLGVALAIACDLQVLTVDARLHLSAARAGLLPAAGVMGRLAEILGYPRAFDLCLTGREIGAREAAELGLAQRVLPRDQIDAGLEALVASLLTVPRHTAAEVKALLRGVAPRVAGRHLSSGAVAVREQRIAEGEAWVRTAAARSDAAS